MNSVQGLKSYFCKASGLQGSISDKCLAKALKNHTSSCQKVSPASREENAFIPLMITYERIHYQLGAFSAALGSNGCGTPLS